jgi:AhpD family alkylhydroperoxidase
MSTKAETFRRERERQNAAIHARKNKNVARFFRLDGAAYEPGALDPKTKELAGLSASLVLRCDDCISYHLLRCKELDVPDEELMEIMNVGLIVGGSIVIPHLRRAVDLLDELAAEED